MFHLILRTPPGDRNSFSFRKEEMQALRRDITQLGRTQAGPQSSLPCFSPNTGESLVQQRQFQLAGCPAWYLARMPTTPLF